MSHAKRMRLVRLLVLFIAGAAAGSGVSRIGAQPARPAETVDSWLAGGRAAVAEARALRPAGDRATNLILFVGDGMGLSTIAAARILEGQMRGGSGEEHQLSFEHFPYVALSKTYTVNQQVGESSATMTAIVTGAKTKDDLVALDQRATPGDPATAAGHELTTIVELAERAGLATGVVTTARITHATPASVYAHNVHRDWEHDGAIPGDQRKTGYPDIARQLIEFDAGDGLEVVLGGGRARFLPATRADPEYPDQKGLREDGRDLAAEWEKKRPDSQAVWNKSQFDAVDATRIRHLLGLFEPSHMQYDHDRPRDRAGEPSLAEMTAKALAMVSRNRRGYVLIVEGGRIDLAHHAGNAYRALTDTIALSDAVRLAQMRTDPRDTLIVVTADHSHTLTIGGYPSRGNPILGKVIENDLRGERQPFPRADLNGQPFTTLSYAQGPGYPGASEQQAEGPKRFPHTPTRSGGAPRGRPNLLFVDTTDPDYMQESALPLNTETHAGEDVAVYATGPGAQLFHGVIEQHVIFHVMARALRLSE